MADLAFLKGYQFFDSSGDPLNGGLIRIYDAGTTSTRTVYQDSAAATPWSQPITLTSAGRLSYSIYVPEGAWKFVITTAADTGFASPIVSEDNIPGASASATSFATPLTPVLSKSANYTIVAADLGSVIRADATGGAFTLTLPSAAATTSGKGFWVMQVGTSGAVTLATVSSQTINGVTTFVLRPQYAHVWIVSDGTNWSAQPSKLLAAAAAKTTTYTVTPADDGRLISCDATAGAFTVTLPTVALAGDGFRIGLKKIDSGANAITVDGDGSETIDGATTQTLAKQYDTVWLRCTGAVWYIEAQPLDSDLKTIAGLTATTNNFIQSASSAWASRTPTEVTASLNAATTALQGMVELATAAEYRTGTDTGRVGAVDQLWASAAEVTLTDAATIAVDFSTFINGVVTLTDNRAMGNPTNEKVGQSGVIRIVQDGTGSRTLSYGTDWEFAGGTAPVLSTPAASQDLLFYHIIASNRIFANLVKAIA